MQSCETLPNLLCQSKILVAEHEEYFRIPYPDPIFRGFQGGCSDGSRYYYQVLMHYELSDRSKDFSCIAKVDLLSRKVVRYSEILHLDHANDITYHPARHLLLVTNNKPSYTRVTLVDPDTLEIVGHEESPVPLYALEYNPTKDLYVAGISGKREFCFLDKDLRHTDGKTYRTIPETDRYTKQDICADDNLLYFILWDGKHKNLPDFQNTVALYDWSGNSRGLLHFNIGVQEPESISIVNGEIYAVCGCGSDPMIYRLTPKLP
jgi:hypothetical protein